MPNPITRTLSRWNETRKHRREAKRLAAMPPYLLRDAGLSLEGMAAIAAQLHG